MEHLHKGNVLLKTPAKFKPCRFIVKLKFANYIFDFLLRKYTQMHCIEWLVFFPFENQICNMQLRIKEE